MSTNNALVSSAAVAITAKTTPLLLLSRLLPMHRHEASFASSLRLGHLISHMQKTRERRAQPEEQLQRKVPDRVEVELPPTPTLEDTEIEPLQQNE